ncbi:E3 ubiquitin-protein ligase ARIH2 [Corchorus olitorius]|uniref:E3 ubiquitin-protein ligase ARIH2 n=1 Tax=Corchorus olitorius TaxID=93759 RepID=A0A1R3KST6_9ROSI|nr:E3 ubiquitin-protein ligase ARIH2 [Corchorus olitorius]
MKNPNPKNTTPPPKTPHHCASATPNVRPTPEK